MEVGAFGNERVEAFEVGLHRVDRVGLAGEIEQASRVAAGHARDDGFCCGQGFALSVFACSRELWVFCQRLGSGPLRTRASPWDLSGTWTFAGPHGKAREAWENRRVANIPRNGVQHRDASPNPGFSAPPHRRRTLPP